MQKDRYKDWLREMTALGQKIKVGYEDCVETSADVDKCQALVTFWVVEGKCCPTCSGRLVTDGKQTWCGEKGKECTGC